ncbi:MAG: tyrosine--tRNA ligase [Candidatus Aenigmatarchaeota archaeon]
MDIEKRMELILRPPTEEVITSEELRQLLETDTHPIAYNGWEPSGMVHLGTGLMCAYKMKDLIAAGIRFKAYLATWHAWINCKLGGDMTLIRKAAEHFRHSWLALGVKGVEFIWPEQEYDDIGYWNKVINVARHMTVARATRTLEIAGRKDVEANYVSDFIYTPMQVADIFQFDVKICQLGMDQRKANVVARELGPSMGFWKPICVHHHLLQGLARPPVWPLPVGKQKEILTTIKMSKSKPETCVFIYDSPDEIRKKIGSAFCPEKMVEFNPIIDICKYIVFRETDTLNIERPAKFGGKLELQSFEELVKIYRGGKLHPQDLKAAVAEVLVKTLKPVRDYFAKNKEAAECLNIIQTAKITR